MKMLRRIRRRGSATIVMLGVAAVLILFGLFFLDMLELYDAQYNISVKAQRGVNSLVEYAMDDALRWDGYNWLDVGVANAHWKEFLDDSLGVTNGKHYSRNGTLQYTVSYGTPVIFRGTKTENAYMEIPITVHLYSGLARYYGRNGYEWTNTFKSTNFRTDDNYRQGA